MQSPRSDQCLEVRQVEPRLGRVDDLVVVAERVGDRRQQRLLVAERDGGGPGDAGAELEDLPVRSLEPVRVAA